MQAKQICLLASREAKGGTGMVAIAGQYLNLVLEELKLVRNLKVNLVTQSLTVQAATYGPFALESDYLRTYDLWYPLPAAGGATSSSMTQFLVPITMDSNSTLSSNRRRSAITPTNSRPIFPTGAQNMERRSAGRWLIDDSFGQLFIYPQTSGQITLTHTAT